jgi:hypothetical protein
MFHTVSLKTWGRLIAASVPRRYHACDVDRCSYAQACAESRDGLAAGGKEAFVSAAGYPDVRVCAPVKGDAATADTCDTTRRGRFRRHTHAAQARHSVFLLCSAFFQQFHAGWKQRPASVRTSWYRQNHDSVGTHCSCSYATMCIALSQHVSGEAVCNGSMLLSRQR